MYVYCRRAATLIRGEIHPPVNSPTPMSSDFVMLEIALRCLFPYGYLYYHKCKSFLSLRSDEQFNIATTHNEQMLI
jgi:hypothetical protein